MSENQSINTTVHKRYRYRIYPTDEQQDFMRQNCGAARYVYNRFVEMGNEDMKAGCKVKRYGYPELFADAPWLKDMDACALDSAKRDYYSALKRYFEDPKVGKPKKKTKKSARKSYRTNNQKNSNTIWIKKNKLKLPKIKQPIKIVKHRYLPEGCRITSATIIEETRGVWYASLVVEYDIEFPQELIVPLNRIRALDYSSPLFYVDDEGNSPEMVKQYRTEENKLSYLQSKKDKRKYASNNWWDAHDEVAREHASVTHKRKDFTEQESAILTALNDIIIVEDVNLQGLSQSLNLGKATNDNGFGMFREQLNYKLSERGGALVKVPRFFASSKICSTCGYKNNDVVLGIDEWDCPECNTHHERDINAAKNQRSCGLFGLIYDGFVRKVVTTNDEVVAVNEVVEGNADILRIVENGVLPDNRNVAALIFDAEEAYVGENGSVNFAPVMVSSDAADVWCEVKILTRD